METSLTEPNADEISEEEKKNIISLQEYIDDLNKRQKWRQQLRKANTDNTNRLDESELRKFDSSLKKVNFGTLNMRYTSNRVEFNICVLQTVHYIVISFLLEYSFCTKSEKFQRIRKKEFTR